MKKSTQTSTLRRAFRCPQCNKPRMIRAADHVVSHDRRTVDTKDNKTVDLLVDICDFCQTRNSKKYFEPSKADIRKLLHAMKTEESSGDESLEDLL